MKRKILLAAVVAVALINTLPAQAADRKVMLPLAAAMADNDAQSRLGDSVKFYFGNQPTPPVLSKLGVDKTSQKTNAFGKSDEKACHWVFLSAMLRLQKRAIDLGANAVVNIVSNYDNIEYSSSTEFECHVGAIMAGAAFKGEFVKIAK
ncbi:excinuclease ATPase subunit [Collimonas sp. NPDC087041]|uniref:excinuclease ATPase subunit n=1 Tax=Collimonas sp. NPDC087041 TaxID=3363960 RepID=UPI0038140030